MSTDDPTAVVTSHSNVVTITDESNTLKNIVYLGPLVVSEGQPHDPAPTFAKSGNVFKITLEAGRRNTAPVAHAFNTITGGKDHEYAPFKEIDHSPDDLNFFFGVQLQFEFEGASGVADVYLGQGHVLGVNNWWIGSPLITNFGEPQLVYTADIKEVSLALSGTHDSFTLREVDVRKLSPIQHVFVLMLENHSFDNMLAMSGIRGLDVATTADSNSYDGITYHVTDGARPSMPTDPGHEFTDVLVQLCGPNVDYNGGSYPQPINNSGFVASYATTTTEGPKPHKDQRGDIMECFHTSFQLSILYQLASNFAVCDHWFSSLPGPTWPNRFFLHGASSNGLDESPTTKELAEWETLDKFRYPHGSIYDAMRTHEISFGLFIDREGTIEGRLAQVASIHGLSLLHVHYVDEFVEDLQGDYPYQYTFIEPNYGDILNNSYEDGSSQHPMDGVARGEQLIQTVYEAIRNSSIWERSMLIITYDEHGGFYDHVAPPGAADGVVPPDDGGEKYNHNGFLFDQLGVRVPAVIVSPWIKAQVDSTRYDHSSVLKTLEQLFGLPNLTERDLKAHDVLHLIGDELRTDCPLSLGRPAPEPIRPQMTAAHRMILDQQPLPPRGNHLGFLAVAIATDREMSAGTPADHAAITAKTHAIRTKGEARAYMQDVVTRAEAIKTRRRTR